MLACFLDFFFTSAVVGPSNTAVERFHFLQWMLGDVLEAVAKEQGRDMHQMAVELVGTDFEGLPHSMLRAVRAARTTMVSHLLARSGRQPWGIQAHLSTEALGQLVAGVHILLWVLCFEARTELGDARIITILLLTTIHIVAKILYTILALGAMVDAMSVATHIYQSSDLAGSRRKEIVEAAQRGPTLLRTPSGDALAFLPQAELERLSRIRDHALGFVMLESALRRPREERRAADFGAWAFASSLDEEQLIEFRDDISDALMRACAGVDAVDSLLNDWRATASFMADEDAVAALGEGLEGFSEVPRPEES